MINNPGGLKPPGLLFLGRVSTKNEHLGSLIVTPIFLLVYIMDVHEKCQTLTPFGVQFEPAGRPVCMEFRQDGQLSLRSDELINLFAAFWLRFLRQSLS